MGEYLLQSAVPSFEVDEGALLPRDPGVLVRSVVDQTNPHQKGQQVTHTYRQLNVTNVIPHLLTVVLGGVVCLD